MSEKEQHPSENSYNPPAGYYEPPPPYAPTEQGDKPFQDGAGPNFPGTPSSYPPSAYPPTSGAAQQPYAVGAYPPAAPTMTTVIVSHSPAIVGPYPVNVQCPHCNTPVVTSVTPVTGIITWLVCAGCVFFGCIFGCCLIPFCASSLQDVDHHCPQCKHFIGRYRRI